MIHLNTAGAGLMPESVATAMIECVRREVEHGAYETELHYDKILQQEVYERIAALVNAPVEDIAFFDSATRAWCAVVCRLDLKAGEKVWVTPYEYAGNLISLLALRDRTGCVIETIPTTGTGDLDLEWIAANISDDVAFVSLTYIPSGCGIVNPVAEIGRILAPYRAFYAVDACQAIGQVNVDVAEIGCHLLSGAGRKFLRGPRGTGFAYVAPELRATLITDTHDLHVARVVSPTEYVVEDTSARGLELAERTTAAVLGFNAALIHFDSVDAFAQHEVFQALRSTLAELPVELIEPGTRHSGIVSFRHASIPAEQIRDELGARGINGWKIRGDHTPIFMAERGIDTAVRLSVHYYTSLDDVAAAGRALREILGA
ncbi:Selenocysteine lyase/Cysteine desulfurase [Actinokineospora alba]|uniref:Selenocysteine lyase/Cysteine desulfurase n=1 Tax=Actinokineospora alba TaxID=504798 RepID=A0A1H0FZ21_9PSEU|nr:aminotransferase class V-fold PLP-dependent enzyme [Actinokineospora alba]TDP69689.1 selenocysteine lyase/cysteine desulfurase [Actinokineospora alba]SDI11124.1 Selenocysteine lyase/Cysteine desulfurase [Actinokineospora alba]SDN99896.1 Selenocysteine lyase/Cysteine desulfurase [Actinokineospora alba]